MLKYFKGSFLITIMGLVCAYIWGARIHHGSGLLALFVVIFLSILEVTLSFDNAVINAVKLEKLTPKWQHRFLTLGIIIAVFGMRFLFPVVVVSVFAQLPLVDVVNLALHNVDKYTHYLHIAHAPLVTFGGSFLFMLFLSYFCNPDKNTHWIKPIEKHLSCCKIKSFEVVLSLLVVSAVQLIVPEEQKLHVTLAGFWGIVLYLIIDSVSNFLENIAEEKAKVIGNTAKLGFVGFLYLELIDASFSLDGVLGAFAISKDIVIITIGLAIGAMFVRSLTIYMVEKKTLKQYLYLEHGAHWAIGFLSLIMFYSTIKEVPEIVTGSIGLIFIVAALISSITHNKKSNSQ